MAVYSYAFLCFCIIAAVAGQQINVSFNQDSADFQVYIDGEEWFRSGALGIRDGGQWWSTEHADKYSLKQSDFDIEEGVDPVGPFTKHM